jgi:hypothetical protein
MAQLVLSEEERVVDQELGYPRCYGKLCRRAFAGSDVGFFTPFIAGPPQRFVPYSLPAEDVSSLSLSLSLRDTHNTAVQFLGGSVLLTD